MKKLNEMTSKELKEIAKNLKVSNWWKLKKEVLIQKIEEVQNMTDEEKAAAAEQKAKEDEALAIYQKHWARYTKRYNPVEFIEKFRSGEIKLEVEEKEVEHIENDVETIEEIVGQDSLEDQKRDEERIEKEKTKKKPRGKLIEFEGRSMNLSQWSKELGIPGQTLFGRLYNLKWSVEKAFTTPAKKK